MTQDPLTLYKLIVLYMLNKVKFKLTYAQISEFILEKEYTNFLTLQEVISDLQDTELIKADTTMNRTYFSITDEGRNTLSYFGNRIGEAIIADIDAFLAEKHLELKNEASITSTYYKATTGEFEAQLIAREKDICPFPFRFLQKNRRNVFIPDPSVIRSFEKGERAVHSALCKRCSERGEEEVQYETHCGAGRLRPRLLLCV